MSGGAKPARSSCCGRAITASVPSSCGRTPGSCGGLSSLVSVGKARPLGPAGPSMPASSTRGCETHQPPPRLATLPGPHARYKDDGPPPRLRHRRRQPPEAVRSAAGARHAAPSQGNRFGVWFVGPSSARLADKTTGHEADIAFSDTEPKSTASPRPASPKLTPDPMPKKPARLSVEPGRMWQHRLTPASTDAVYDAGRHRLQACRQFRVVSRVCRRWKQSHRLRRWAWRRNG